MITTANMITASAAEEIGLVNHVVPQTDLISKAEEILNLIKQRAPLAVSAALKAVIAAVNNNNGYATEIEAFGNCFETTDFKEGVAAFVEKRKPNFLGK